MAGFLVFPFLTLIFYIDRWQFPTTIEIWRSFRFTVEQAFLSAAFSMAFGILGALGLLRLRRSRRSIEIFLLLPNLIPTLFVILAGLKVLDPFPFGLWGIVILHAGINTGLVAVTFAQIFENQVGGWVELACIEGAHRLPLLLVLLRYLKREISVLFLFVFTICFSSLTIPLIAGGFEESTLEVLIYEKVRISQNWSEAFGVAIFQSIFIFILTSLLVRKNARSISQPKNLRRLSWIWGIVPAFLFSSVILLTQLEGFPMGLRQMQANPIFKESLWQGFQGTLLVGFGVGLTSYFLLALVLFLLPNERFQKFLIGYVDPSSVLTGFSLLLIFKETYVFEQMIAGITVIQLPFFSRLYVDNRWNQILPQVQTAQTLSASSAQIFSHIVFPQAAKSLGLAAGLAGLWACGEFAVSSLITGQDVTLALLTKKLLSSYRLEIATVLVWCMMGAGALVWLIFWGSANVLGRKSTS
jgi:thiamine transport system permease protein